MHHVLFYKRVPFLAIINRDPSPNNILMRKGKNRPKYRQKEDPPPQDEYSERDTPVNQPRPKVEEPRQRGGYNLPKPRSYVERQESSAQYDEHCIICSELMKNREAIWNCTQCCKFMHLKCIKRWILNCNKDSKKYQNLNWSCPQCKYEYSEPMPQYYCFCGKFKNPEYDREIPAHSCGNFCEKKRGPNCHHPCPLKCHRGKCPPCNFQGMRINCCCGKQSMKIKCSDEMTHFLCTSKCEKLLSCKKHKCNKPCHLGPCNPCNFKHMASCFCGKNQDIINCQLTSYSCESICNKELDCGNHKCQEKCHSGNCQPCLRKPETTKKCPCGQFELMMLMNDERKACTDPIPLCGMPCKKKLPCGHNCTKSCHEGPCSQCKIIVNQNCTCTSSQRKAECWMIFDEEQRFVCEKVCKKRKGCGNHLCQTVCCPYKFSNVLNDHQCLVTCEKELNCNKHTCGMPCHAGNCGNCPVLYSQPQYCPCGRTSLRPPISCGVIVPECDNFCSKQMPCGHICKLTCHYGSCQCAQKIFVSCQCQKNMIETDCGRSALCTEKCQQTLPCGHKCHLQCHLPPCLIDCQKVCRKTRSCGHVCLQRCHPSTECTMYPCETQVLIKCECGHRQKMVPCGSTQILLEKHITCNKTCESIKRFKVLYSGKDIYYPSNLVYFGLKNYGYLQKLEDSIEKYIRSEKYDPLHIEFKFGYDQQIKMGMQILFEKHYHLDSYFSPHKKSPFFTILKTQNTMIPSPNLSNYITLVGKGEIKKNSVPFQASLRFGQMTKDKSDALEGYLTEYHHKYYPQRKDKGFFLHFWLSDHAEQAFDLLNDKYPNYPCSLEMHAENIPEEEEVDVSEVIAEEATQKADRNQEIIDKKVEVSKEKPAKTAEELEKERIQLEEMKSKLSKPVSFKKVYPPSSQLVQTMYRLDEEELDGEHVDWEQYGDQLSSRHLGIQASEWRIRAFLIMRATYEKSKHEWLDRSLEKLMEQYNQEKKKAKRLLSHRSFDLQSAEDFLYENDIVLSPHEPEMTSYFILNQYLKGEEIQEFYEELTKSPEVSAALKVIQRLEEQEYEEIFESIKDEEFMFCCSILPLLGKAVERSIQDLVSKGKKFRLETVWQSLKFKSLGDFQKYIDSIGYHTQIKPSKKESGTVYHVLVKNENSPVDLPVPYQLKMDSEMLQKRDVKYANEPPEELLNERYCLLSYFAFGDSKQESNSYINRLIKILKR